MKAVTDGGFLESMEYNNNIIIIYFFLRSNCMYNIYIFLHLISGGALCIIHHNCLSLVT